MRLGGSEVSTYEDIADLFSAYFGSVYSTPVAGTPVVNAVRDFDSNFNLGSVSISLGDVFEKLNKLDLV